MEIAQYRPGCSRPCRRLDKYFLCSILLYCCRFCFPSKQGVGGVLEAHTLREAQEHHSTGVVFLLDSISLLFQFSFSVDEYHGIFWGRNERATTKIDIIQGAVLSSFVSLMRPRLDGKRVLQKSKTDGHGKVRCQNV